VTEREELAQIIDHNAFVYDPNDHTMTLATRQSIVRRRSEALAKADLWLSRPSPVDEVVEALRELYASFDSAVVLEPAMLRRVRTALAAYDQAKEETQ
jgi:hypothetical protein